MTKPTYSMHHIGDEHYLSSQQPPRFIEIRGVTHITSLKKTSIYELVKKGELKPVKLGKKTVFVEAEVLQWMDSKQAARTTRTKEGV